MRDPNTGRVIENVANYGKHIDKLIPTLMPATKKEIDQAELLSRYIINETTEYEYDSERQTPNYLAENYPVTLNFYP